jgi:hypothetical protein
MYISFGVDICCGQVRTGLHTLLKTRNCIAAAFAQVATLDTVKEYTQTQQHITSGLIIYSFDTNTEAIA